MNKLPEGRVPLSNEDLNKLLKEYKTPPVDRYFEVESLDPDERTWYYDGYGTKRLKGR
jgi:hypothetical protein